jgi:hypothetical protein
MFLFMMCTDWQSNHIKVGSSVATNFAVSVAAQKNGKYIVKDNKGGETIGQIWSFSTN